jgi:hypothetical protein
MKTFLKIVILCFTVTLSGAQSPGQWFKRNKTVVTSYALVDSLPVTIGDGVVLMYNGTLWRGLTSGESSLAVGTPWPVKGYKEISCRIGWTAIADTIAYGINDFGVEFTRELRTATDLTLGLAYAATESQVVVVSGNIYNRYDTPPMAAGFHYHRVFGNVQNFFLYQEASGGTDLDGYNSVFLTIKIFPPQL